MVNGQRDIMVIRAVGGQPRTLTDNPAQDMQPTWSRDGMWIYYSSNRSGAMHIWKMPADGGEAVKTPFPGNYALESWDGRTLFYSNKGDLWSSVNGGPATLLLSDAVDPSQNFVAGRDGLYFESRQVAGRPSTIGFVDGRSGEARTLFTMPGRRHFGVSVSPDSSNILFTQRSQPEADIMLVEGFR